MTMWKRLRSWLRAIMLRSRMEREMDAELRFHIEAFAEIWCAAVCRGRSLAESAY